MMFPRTFDLNDVTDVMNICDRHLGAIAMRVSCNYVSCPQHCARVHLVGSLAIATASTCDSFDREGPPTVNNRSCRLHPTEIESEICKR